MENLTIERSYSPNFVLRTFLTKCEACFKGSKGATKQGFLKVKGSIQMDSRRCSDFDNAQWKFRKIHRQTLVPESLF